MLEVVGKAEYFREKMIEIAWIEDPMFRIFFYETSLFRFKSYVSP